MHPTTKQILARLQRHAVACWLLTDDEREFVETSSEWRIIVRNGTRLAVCTL